MTRRGSLPHHPLRLRLRLRNDKGIALPMVLMVFIVGVALISAFLVAIVGSSQVTATSKNIVQAQAAAEAGIAAAEARMRAAGADPCLTDLSALASASASLTYTFTTAKPSCVDVNGKKQVVVRATGTSSDTQATVEATFTWVSGGTPAAMTGNNILYIGGGENFAPQNNSIQFLDPLDEKPTVTIRSGAFQCKNLVLPGGLIIGGVFTLDGPCTVNGDAYFGKTVNWNDSALTVTGGIKSVDGEVKLTAPVGGAVEANGAVTASSKVGGSISTRSNVTLNAGASVGTSASPASVTSGGNVTVGAGAKVFGDIVASGTVTIEPGAWVSGNVTAGGNVDVKATSRTLGVVEGDIYSGGIVDLSGQVGIVTSNTIQRPGNVTGLAGVKVAADRVVPGRIVSGGNVDLSGANWVGRTLSVTCKVEARGNVNWTRPPSGVNVATGVCKPPNGAPTAPVIATVALVPAPVIPGWMEYQNTPSDIEKWTGFDDIPATGAWECSKWNGKKIPEAWKALSALEVPSYFNLSNCDISAKGENKSTIVLTRDIVIVAKSFDLEKFNFVAGTNANPRLWLIQPGKTSDGAPVCVGTKTAVTLKDVDIAAPIVTMVYTPCEVKIQNKVTITGNLYASGVDTQGSGNHSSISFSPIEILSWSAGEDDEDETTGTGTPSLGSLLVQRNVD